MKYLLALILSVSLLGGCKKDKDSDDFNMSATSWRGTHVQGGGTETENYSFIAGGSFQGTTTLNGYPRAMTGTWTQDGDRISVINVTIDAYSGIFRINLTLTADHTRIQGDVAHTTSQSLHWNVDLARQ